MLVFCVQLWFGDEWSEGTNFDDLAAAKRFIVERRRSGWTARLITKNEI